MGKSVKIVDLAKRMIQLSGLTEGQDIEISFTGLRPGEKLFEELLGNDENNMSTHHPKIMIANTRKVDFSEVKVDFDTLNDLLNEQKETKDFDLVAQLKSFIVEYKSKASRFEVLDK